MKNWMKAARQLWRRPSDRGTTTLAQRPGLKHVLWLIIAVLVIAGFGLPGQNCPDTQGDSRGAREVRTLLPSEWNVPYPAGISYSLDHDQLFLLEKIPQGQAPPSTTDVVVITPYEDWIGTATLEFPVENRVNLSFDDATDRLLLFNNSLAELAQVQMGVDNRLDPGTLTRQSLSSLGLGNVQGMDVDGTGRRLFLLDSARSEIVILDMSADFGLVSKVDLSPLCAPALRGLAVHPQTKNLFIYSPNEQILYELTQTGELVNRYDLSSLDMVDAQGLDFGPSADLTDPPATIHLFMADSNLSDEQPFRKKVFLPLLGRWGSRNPAGLHAPKTEAQPAPSAVFGRILEVALEPDSDIQPVQRITVQVAHSHDDAEERHNTNRSTKLNSSDLELIRDGELDQTVGIRFTGVSIPAGATILSAFIEFSADENNSEPTSLVIHGEATDNAATFEDSRRNISDRSLTTASVSWPDVPAWTERHATYRTPDLAPIVQEIVHRGGWASGNAMAFIISGSGTRTAESFDGEPALAPRLIVEFTPSSIWPTATPTEADPNRLTPTATATATLTLTPTPTWTPLPVTGGAVRFAAIGDFGKNNADEARVATLVASWNPDFVITLGDNNYPDGEAATMDENVGQYYSTFIGNYQGAYGPGSSTNRFWPTLGNHDWHSISCAGSTCTGPYFDYFTLPNNERYYDVSLGLVHLFALDSDSDEPDDRDPESAQAAWLRDRLAASTACYRLVYFHHAPYSSGRHGSNSSMQWPFALWGADAILSAHDHLYERLTAYGIPYFVNGAGGASLYDFENIGNLPAEATSHMRYNQDHGAMLITATTTGITYQFYTAAGVLIDEYTVAKDCTGTPQTDDPTPTPTPTSTPTPARHNARLRLYGTFQAMGITVSLSIRDDPNQNAIANVAYRQGNQPYQPAFPLSRPDSTRFVGSLFWLEPGTTYDVRVTFSDPDGDPLDGAILEASSSTQAEISIPPARHTFIVSPNGHGSACHLSAPCSLNEGIRRAQPGDAVVLRGGVYYVGDIKMPRSGAPGAPIVIRGAEGEEAILDGADPTPLTWQDAGGGAYATTTLIEDVYLVAANGSRLYPYRNLYDLQRLSQGLPGFYAYRNRLYVHLAGDAHPRDAEIAVSRYNRGIEVEQDYIYFMNLTFRHYGQDSEARAIYIKNASHNLVQDSVFAINNGGITIRDVSHRNVIQDNEFYDTIADWPWESVKAVGQLERGGVYFAGSPSGRGNVIRRNVFHNFFDGFDICPSAPLGPVTNETDVYENLIYNIGDDGVQVDGWCSNVRLWNNTFHDVLTGVSFAPTVGGPIYAIRNLIYRFGRGNTEHDGDSFKFNSGSNNQSGPIYLLHNTTDAIMPDSPGLELSSGGSRGWAFLYTRNNIWSGMSYALRNKDIQYRVDMDYDDLWSRRGNELVRWDQAVYLNLSDFTAATGQELHGLNADPDFVNREDGKYTLQPRSALIDAGVLIPGINDEYTGTAPDIGAFEFSAGGHLAKLILTWANTHQEQE